MTLSPTDIAAAAETGGVAKRSRTAVKDDILIRDESPFPAYFNDFERWCEECVMVTDKITGLPVPFRLNAPQRRLARIMEKERRAGRPVRVILLKARQWGGSTLVQVYMAWMQLVRYSGRNALICAHVKDAASLIRSTYTLLLDSYPDHLKTGDASQWKLKPYQQTQNTLWIPARQARIAITSANNPDALRGASYHLAHLSEAAFWADGDNEAASAIVRTVCGTVPSEPGTLIVIESTADGPDSWFAAEWQRAVAGKSDKMPVFVPWHEIELYRRALDEEQRRALPAMLDEYELRLLADGVSAEAVAWYHDKRREYSTHAEMMAEFPSTPREAFATSSRSPFPAALTASLSRHEDAAPPPCLTVVALAQKMMVVEFGISAGRLHVLRQREAEDVRSLMLAMLKRDSGAVPQLAFIEMPPPDGDRHGRWCMRFARNHALPLCYNADEPLLSPGDEMMGELTDMLLHIMATDRLRDHVEDAAECYRLYDPARPWRSPALLARMAAAMMTERLLEADTVSVADFLKT